MKTNKSYAKRVKVTKTGKVLVRKAGHNHFNAKRSGGEKQRKNRATGFHATMTATDKSRFLS